MKFDMGRCALFVVAVAFLAGESAYAFVGRLSPSDFNKMYYIASKGKIGILREAVNRGLYIDATNPNGDTGLCIAIKRRNYIAYNSFRMSGANPRHACTYKMIKEYQEFLDSNKTVHADKVLGNEESLYYNESDRTWWPWILGGAVVGGGALALSGGGGGGKSNSAPEPVDTPELPAYMGLAPYLDNYGLLISSGGVENKALVDGRNPDAGSVVNKISLLPNMLNNAGYLRSYVKVADGAYYYNLSEGRIKLGDAAIGLAAYGNGSKVMNDGSIEIEARNGSVGMVASNGSQALNGVDTGVSSSTSIDGSISMMFKGSQEGDAVIGMYGDTGSEVVNYGKIIGTATAAEASSGEETSESSGLLVDEQDLSDTGSGTPSRSEENNSGTMLGMSVFNFYTGTDLSTSTVTAKNYGDIKLRAGYNNASTVSVSLIGMGSYLDDNFLYGTNNPSLAERMKLLNMGNIGLSYQGAYTLASGALRLGDGGLIGMRADAVTEAVNQGNISIDLQATNVSSGVDVAAGMLSVHGGDLVNGTAGMAYNGTGTNTGGKISVISEATSGGVYYGMLAAKGNGPQTGLYKWKAPKLVNYGLIDMMVSNGYGMASVAGGEVINEGVINLGNERGQSYYANNYGLYAAGGSISEDVILRNDGIINVYSEKSTAIYNAFTGSVSLENNGTVYISNKATGSNVFGGNFSVAVNNGNISYKVGNSESFTSPTDGTMLSSPKTAVVTAAANGDATKQYFANNGSMVIGAARSEADYGGTYGTAAVQVSKQGSADNYGEIKLEKYDPDTRQFNTAMWLDSETTAESYVNNLGEIIVNSAYSIGILNDTLSDAQATNSGVIRVNGTDGFGMATSDVTGVIFNGRSGDTTSKKEIHVSGEDSIGMFVKNGSAYNYGTIFLENDSTTAFQLSGKTARVKREGTIAYLDGLSDITFFWMDDGALMDLEYDEIEVDGYILAKATKGGSAYFSKSSTAYVSGSNSRLLVAADGGLVYNKGKVYADEGAKAIVAREGGFAYNYGNIYVSGDSVGMYGQGEDSVVSSLVGAVIDVNGGVGIKAEELASADNAGKMDVRQGTGMYLSGGNSTVYTKGTNVGSIVVSGTDSKGVETFDGAMFTNDKGGGISVSSGATGISSSAGVVNSGAISVSGANSKGMDVSGGTASNEGTIEISSGNDTTYGIYNTGGRVENSGSIIVNAGVGAYGAIENSGEIDVYSGAVGVDGSVKNSGTIVVYGTGEGVKGSGENTGTIVNKGNGAGVIASGTFTNEGTISGAGIGAKVVDDGSFINIGSISLTSGTGIYVTEGSAFNRGTIVIGSGKGIHVNGESARAVNEGTISISESGYGAYIENGGEFVNYGTISYDSSKNGKCDNVSGVGGTCVDVAASSDTDTGTETESGTGSETSAAVARFSDVPVYVGENASFVNAGEMNLGENAVDFDTMRADNGNFVVASGGTYVAGSLKGSVVAGKDIVMGGFEDVYVNKNSFNGKNEGLSVASESYLFDASLKEKGDVIDVELHRKDFNDLVEERDLAEFFETNYKLSNNGKMFGALKSASGANEFNNVADSESGKKFYANIARENMAVLRGMNASEQKRILADGIDGGSVGIGYFRTGKDGVGGLSGYADDVYSVYGSYGKRLGKGWSVGASVKAAQVDAEYDDINSNRENKILMALLPVMYQNGGFKFLTMPEAGVGFGTYKRRAVSGVYEADSKDFYYGVYNHAEYSIDMKIAELVTEAELNLQGISAAKAKEKGGLNLGANDAVSLEAGIGLKLRKRFKFARERSLELALGTKYYHELLNPYKDLSIGMNGSPVEYSLNGYDENKNRLKTTAEAVYKDGDLSVAAEISHNAEKEANLEGGIGVRYGFN